MIKAREIYKIQSDIEALQNSSGSGSGGNCSAMKPKKIDILVADWTLNADTTLYEYTLTHSEEISLEYLAINYYHQNEAMYLTHKFVDNSNVTIYSDEAVDISLIIYNKHIDSGAKVDMGEYATKDDIVSIYDNMSDYGYYNEGMVISGLTSPPIVINDNTTISYHDGEIYAIGLGDSAISHIYNITNDNWRILPSGYYTSMQTGIVVQGVIYQLSNGSIKCYDTHNSQNGWVQLNGLSAPSINKYGAEILSNGIDKIYIMTWAGGSNTRLFIYDIVKNQWDVKGLSSNGSGNSPTSACYIASEHAIYFYMTSEGMLKYDLNTDTISDVSSIPSKTYFGIYYDGDDIMYLMSTNSITKYTLSNNVHSPYIDSIGGENGIMVNGRFYINDGVSFKSYDVNASVPYESRCARADADNITKYIGVDSQIIVNSTSKQLHVMDGTTPGGHVVGRDKVDKVEGSSLITTEKLALIDTNTANILTKAEADHTHEGLGCDDPFIKDWGDLPKTPMENAPISKIIFPAEWDSDVYVKFTRDSAAFLAKTCEFANGNVRISGYMSWSITMDFSNVDPTSGAITNANALRNIETNSIEFRDLFILNGYGIGDILMTKLSGNQSIKANVSLVKGDTLSLNEYKGISGEIIANMESKQIHLMDGETLGGTIIGGSGGGVEIDDTATIETASSEKTFSAKKILALIEELKKHNEEVSREGRRLIAEALNDKKPTLNASADSTYDELAMYISLLGNIDYKRGEVVRCKPLDTNTTGIDNVAIITDDIIMCNPSEIISTLSKLIDTKAASENISIQKEDIISLNTNEVVDTSTQLIDTKIARETIRMDIGGDIITPEILEFIITNSINTENIVATASVLVEFE